MNMLFTFKMDTLESAIRLMSPGCYMVSVDLRDAYYSVPMSDSCMKFLRFQWSKSLYEYTCLSQGL